MFYLYYNHELIACSNTFNEIADIFIVECLGIDKSNYHTYCIIYNLFDEWFVRSDGLNKGRVQLQAWIPDGLFEVRFYGKG